MKIIKILLVTIIFQIISTNIAFGVAEATNENEEITFNMKSADTRSFISTISKYTGTNIYYDDIELGKVHIISATTVVGKEGAFKLFEDIMYAKGFDVEQRDENSYAIIKQKQSAKVFDVAMIVAIALAIINIIIFVALTITSRWYGRSLSVLTHPLIQRVGLYFDFAMSNSRWIQLWVLDRYFFSLKSKIELEKKYSYVNAKGIDDSGCEYDTESLILKFKDVPKLWMQGTSGTGKSELLKNIIYVYTREDNIFKAWKKYGFVPLDIPLREFSDVSPDKFCNLLLSQHGVYFGSDVILNNIVKSNLFLFQLDGMNEVDLEKPVLQYIKSVGDSTKCILTSQLLPKYWDVPVFKLESPDANMSMKLVAAFLNDCNEIECSLPSNLVNSDIWDSLQSAYECKLIAALVRQNNKIPHDRGQLYEAQISEVKKQWENYYDSAYPEVIYEFAWNKWLVNERRFLHDDVLTDENVSFLLNVGVLVTRSDKYEFSHDLMRAFIIAKYLFLNLTDKEHIEKCFSLSSVWSHTDVELGLIFNFMTKMIDNDTDLSFLANIAAQDPSNRKQLLISLTEYTNHNNLQIQFV